MSSLALAEAPSAVAGEAKSRRSHEGLRFQVTSHDAYTIAQDLDDVLVAWRLVYDTYRSAGLIDANPRGVHFPRQAVSPDTIVVLHRIDGALESTLSAYADGPDKLPLDSVYAEELDALRDQGRDLVEVGMLAHRGETSSMAALANLMRFSFYFAMLSGRDDLVVGVHPHHVRFYIRMFGFEQAGPLRVYPLVKEHPVVLLRLDVMRQWTASEQPRGAQHCIDNPIDAHVFGRRFRFDADDIAGSPLLLPNAKAMQSVA